MLVFSFTFIKNCEEMFRQLKHVIANLIQINHVVKIYSLKHKQMFEKDFHRKGAKLFPVFHPFDLQFN